MNKETTLNESGSRPEITTKMLLHDVTESGQVQVVKKTVWQSNRKAFIGFSLSMVASVFQTASNILLRKTYFFNEFDNSTIRFVVQLLVGISIAIVTKNSLVGKRTDLKLLLGRGAISGIGLSAFYASIKLIDPSDAISLFSCNVIFVAILSRIFMKEKFTVLHLLALVFVVFGVFLITQPSFLIAKPFKLVRMRISILNF
jgi:drug/metabolite transporter (DMT)-like permease